MSRTTWRMSQIVFLGLICGAALSACSSETPTETATAANDYLFCFWNLENFFDDHDDHDDHRENRADREYDAWFAHDDKALQLKLSHLSEALIGLNHGKGPDIIATAEVEDPRAAELLREALNQRLSDPSLHYTNVLMKDLSAGRHIAPAIITRLPVQRDRTRLHGSRLRILEGHIKVNNHDLVVIASHWTSRLSDKEGSDHGGRAKYGDQIHGLFRGMYKSNPQVDFLVCGDFNDDPWDKSVTEHLHATGNKEDVLDRGRGDMLLDLFANKDPDAGFGTLYGGKWHIFDQVAVSPGLLDEQGWSCDPSTARTVTVTANPHDHKHRPWRFGSPHDKHPRGYSDHFPVTVQLRLHP